MAEYKEIKGFQVQSFAADPLPSVAAWSAGGNLNVGRSALAAAAQSTQTAGLVFGGNLFFLGLSV